jgi:CheY-like chemotaxis protein
MAAKRVLLVDDDPTFIRSLCEALSGFVDFRVVNTRSAALEAAASWHPHVIVLDSLLRESDPFRLLDELQSRACPSFGVICLTRGPGATTRCLLAAGAFFGAVRREAGPQVLRAAILAATSRTPSAI